MYFCTFYSKVYISEYYRVKHIFGSMVRKSTYFIGNFTICRHTCYFFFVIFLTGFMQIQDLVLFFFFQIFFTFEDGHGSFPALKFQIKFHVTPFSITGVFLQHKFQVWLAKIKITILQQKFCFRIGSCD